MKDRSASNVDLEQQLEGLKRDLVEARDRLATALAASAAEASHRHRLAAIVEASRDAIWSWNVEGIIESRGTRRPSGFLSTALTKLSGALFSF